VVGELTYGTPAALWNVFNTEIVLARLGRMAAEARHKHDGRFLEEVPDGTTPSHDRIPHLFVRRPTHGLDFPFEHSEARNAFIKLFRLRSSSWPAP